MNNKERITTIILVFLLCCFSIGAKNEGNYSIFFADFKTDNVRTTNVDFVARSLITKAYTLDMLYKNQDTRTMYNSLDVKYLFKNKTAIIETDLKNKYGVLIDLGKKKNIKLEIYNDSNYLKYYRAVKRNEIASYLMSLKSSNREWIPIFISESALYFNNPEFYCAYAEYLTSQSKNKLRQEISDYYLLGGDYQKAAQIIDKNNFYSQEQRAFVYAKASLFKKAFETILTSSKSSNEWLSEICEMIVLDSSLNDDDKETELSYLPANISTSLIEYYSEAKEYLKGYLFAKYRFKSNTELLLSLKSKENNLLETSPDTVINTKLPLYLQAGWNRDVYETFVKKNNYASAVEIMDKNRNIIYSDTLSTFSNAAAQLARNNESNNISRVISLYARANDWNNAGLYASKANDVSKAIEYYEKGNPKNTAELSKLYEKSGNYIQAAHYLVLSDSTSYAPIATLFEKGKDYRQATLFYQRGYFRTKSIACAELIQPKDYKLLIDLYYASGNNQKVLDYLEQLYREEPLLAGEYYIKTGNVETYRDKLLDAGKNQEALNTYSLEDDYSIENLNWLIELTIKANDKTKEISFTNAKLNRLFVNIENMSIEEIDDAIVLATNIGNNTMKQKFVTQKNSEINRIAKEEREEKARLAKEAREERDRQLAEDREEKKKNALFSKVAGVYRWEDMAYISLKIDGSFIMYSKLMNVGYRYGHYRILDASSPITVQMNFDNDRFGGGTQTAYVSVRTLSIGSTKYFKD